MWDIISELPLAPSEKTIPPKNMGGVAGGTKFIVNGIYFKLATDPWLKSAGLSTSIFEGLVGVCESRS